MFQTEQGRVIFYDRGYKRQHHVEIRALKVKHFVKYSIL